MLILVNISFNFNEIFLEREVSLAIKGKSGLAREYDDEPASK